MNLFGRRRKHPLPKFPPTAATFFHRLCGELGEGEYEELHQLVLGALQELRQKMSSKTFYTHDTVDGLERVSAHLLIIYPECVPTQQRLIVGALRYLALDDDGLPEMYFASGLNDDIAILNHVLEELGVEGMFLGRV